MPPSLPSSSLGSLARGKQSLCFKSAARTFTSSSQCQAIGPESPKFIEIPLPRQRFAQKHVDVKGVLPVPRNIFPKRAGDKSSPQYIARATFEPTAAHQLTKNPSEYTAWKRRMAASRRENLREGLTKLYDRKVKKDAQVARKSSITQENNQRLVDAPQRESDRLTSPTITAAMATFQHGALPDPNRAARIAASAEKVAAKIKAQEEARRDSLHSLYMHARSFITTEKELDAEIDKIFTERPFAHVHGRENETNIWDAEGSPMTVFSMLSEVSNTQKKAVDYYQTPAKVTGKRMVKIAEELTGGKMD
ncbi:hypothetical protein VE04_05830 [Pseudogymnoascus sp. 24MN13]|nr:hypothetical protein VE04_05830 [Pseudogymnoascus sp. 24MN13]